MPPWTLQSPPLGGAARLASMDILSSNAVQKGMIVLHPATADDETFVNDLLFTTMHGYVEATWPNDPVAHRHYYEITAVR